MIEKYFIVTSNLVELRINRVRINRFRPVFDIFLWYLNELCITC